MTRLTRDVSEFFYNLGRHLGRKAVPAIRKSKLIWAGVAGNEEEALRAEISLGKQMAAELHTTLEVIHDPPTKSWLSDLCGQLSARARDKRRTFQCELFRDPFPNAMALPGGFLFLSDSLLALGERRPEEVAFLLGHEMAHVLRGHAWDRMVNEAVLRAAAVATARIGQLGAWLRQQGIALLRSAHARDQEAEADQLGLRLAAAAGYDPVGGVRLLQRIARLHPVPDALGQYLASHPPPAERIVGLQRIIGQLPQKRPQESI